MTVIDNERFRKLLLSLPGKAIAFLYDNYYHSLVRIAESLTHDHIASEDIVQETFAYIWTNYEKLGQHHDISIQHYLVKVVKYKAISHYKRSVQKQHQKVRFLNGQDSKRDPPVENKIIQWETSLEIRHVIDTFPRRERECLLMRIDEEMTLEQMALRMNVSTKAVERSMTSANKRLRQYWLSKK